MTRITLMFALLLAHAPALAAPAPAPPAPEAPPPVKDHAVPLLLDFKPQSLQFNSYCQFNDAGALQHQHQQCTLGVQVFYNPLASPVGYRDVKLTRVLTDAGEELELPENPGNQSYFNNDRQQRPRFFFSLQLPYPPAHARGYAQITGTLTVQVGVEPVKEASLPPIKDIEGKRVRIEGLGENVSLSTRREGKDEGGRLLLDMPMRTSMMVAGVRLVSAGGADLPLQDAGRGSNNNSVTRYYQGAAPDDARIVVSFYSGLSEVEATFTLRDLKLPGADAGKGEDVVVQAIVPQAAKREHRENADAPAPPAPPGDLRVIVD